MAGYVFQIISAFVTLVWFLKLCKLENKMPVNKFGYGIVVFFAIASLSGAGTETTSAVKKLLIDTDVGIDDAGALLMALEAEEHNDGVKVIGITCVNGNTDVDQVALNVLKVLKLADRLDIPVYKGASHPLLLPGIKDQFYGRDGFGGFDLPDPPSADLIQSKHAVNAMIDMVKANPGEITLLALGPLTNVALAIRMYPEFLDELQQLVVMGGSTEGRGNVHPATEFNFFVDPVATYVVFDSVTSNPLVLVPLETTRKTLTPLEIQTSLSDSNETIVWLVDFTNKPDSDTDFPSLYFPDMVAAAVAITSGSIVTESETYYTEAVYDGSKAAGMIIVDYLNITAKAANTNIIQDIDMKVYKELLLRYFRSVDANQMPQNVTWRVLA